MHFLDEVGRWFATGANWWGPNGIADRALLQVELSAAVVFAASVLGIGVGFVLGHFQRGGFVAVNAANAARAVPSLALLTLLVIWPVVSLKARRRRCPSFLTLVALHVSPRCSPTATSRCARSTPT